MPTAETPSTQDARTEISAPPLADLLAVDQVAERYVRLVLAVGEHDDGYVDAYYGPGLWRTEVQTAQMPLAQIDAGAQAAVAQLQALQLPQEPMVRLRQRFLQRQLEALSVHVRKLRGAQLRFNDEAKALYDVLPPALDRVALTDQLNNLETLLPAGKGTLSQRYNDYLQRFAIPADRLESVMRVTIDEARRRTARRIKLPEGEQFELALVKDKPWSAYNWYQGNFLSRIEINTDLPVTAARVIELAVHEGYPGHHVYNSLLEQALVRGRGWIEYCVYPLYSPQSLIAEGSADFAIDLSFSIDERAAFYQEVLFPLAGFEPAEARRYAQITEAAKFTGMATIDAARNWLDGRATEQQVLKQLQDEALATPERARQRLAFFRGYRSYIVNYSLGEALVETYVQTLAGDDATTRWLVFADLLASPALPADLEIPDPKK
ncbi:MAG: hypothetical protein M3O62_13565 [Pseudomonadota bacterium]|nr:hypothetical protein [Pseudomonadota bacterium]